MSNPQKNYKFPDKQNKVTMINRPAGGYLKKNCVLSLIYNSRTPLSAVFAWGLKVTNKQLDRKTFEVDKWVLLGIPTGQ